MRLAAIAAGLCSNHHYPAAPNHRLVDLPASVLGIVVTLKSLTVVTKTASHALNAHSLPPNLASVERTI